MKQKIALSLFALGMAFYAQAERIEPVPYGDFEQWAVRYIYESGIIGGATRTIYAIAPTDTISGNIPFKYKESGSPWSVSNAYARVSGIDKCSGTTTPEKRDNGYCCRMDCRLEQIVVLGCINLKVMITGTAFLGQTIEPIRSANDPYSNVDYGIPFTERPAYLMFDYKSVISTDSVLTIAKGQARPKNVKGTDKAEVVLLLQKRWEDKDGNIYATRVGTVREQFSETQQEWQNGYRTKVHYGNITDKPYYRNYMGLNQPYRAMNSKGKIVPIQEIGWADSNEMPTHAIMIFSAGYHEAFVGGNGNVFWIDNVSFVYE